MSTKIKPELLNTTLDTNGIGLNLPSEAIGVVGAPLDGEFKVIRGGQELAVKPGDVLLKGDIIRTGSATQTIFLSSAQAVAMSKVALAGNQEFALDTNIELTLDGELVEVAATDALNPDLLAMAEGEGVGLFGSLGAMTIGGVPAAGVAAGGIALAALAGGSGGEEAAPADQPPPDNGGEQMPTGGPLSDGATQLDGALAGTPLGGNLPFSFADGASQLEGALALPAAPADAGGTNPLSDVASNLSNAIGAPAELPQTITNSISSALPPVDGLPLTLPVLG